MTGWCHDEVLVLLCYGSLRLVVCWWLERSIKGAGVVVIGRREWKDSERRLTYVAYGGISGYVAGIMRSVLVYIMRNVWCNGMKNSAGAVVLCCGEPTDLRVVGTPSLVVGPTPVTFLGPSTAKRRPAPPSSSLSYSLLMTYTAGRHTGETALDEGFQTFWSWLVTHW